MEVVTSAIVEVVSCVEKIDVQTKEEINSIENIPIIEPLLRSADVEVIAGSVEQEVSDDTGDQEIKLSVIDDKIAKEKGCKQMVSNADENQETVGF